MMMSPLSGGESFFRTRRSSSGIPQTKGKRVVKLLQGSDGRWL